MNRIVVKADKNLVSRFKLLAKSELGKSLMIDFNYNLPSDSVTVDYDIKKSIWDKKEKDYNFDFLMFDRSNGYLYIYPQASEVYIPMVNAKKYFNLLVKEVFNIEIDISGKNLDRLFQTLKLTRNKEERINYIRECIESSISSSFSTNLGKLLNRELTRDFINLSEIDCRIFEFRFTQSLINFIEVINSVIASVESDRLISNNLEGLFSSNILIHKSLNRFFKSELWSKIKNIFGTYDREFISSGYISGLIPEFSMNVLFLPVIQEYLNLGILDLEGLDREYFNISNSLSKKKSINLDNKKDYCLEKDSDILDSLVKVLNIVELLPVYETSVLQVLPNLSPEELSDSKFIDYFNYKNNQLITLSELNRVRKIYSKNNSLAVLDKDLEGLEDTSDREYIDISLYILPRKIPDLMTSILTKYFV